MNLRADFWMRNNQFWEKLHFKILIVRIQTVLCEKYNKVKEILTNKNLDDNHFFVFMYLMFNYSNGDILLNMH